MFDLFQLQDNDKKPSPGTRVTSPPNSSFNSSFGTDIDMNEDFLLALEQVEADYQGQHVKGQLQNVKGQDGASRADVGQSNKCEQSSGLQNEIPKTKTGFVKFVKSVSKAEDAIESGTNNVESLNEKIESNNSRETSRTSLSIQENTTNSLSNHSLQSRSNTNTSSAINSISRGGSSSSISSNQNQGSKISSNQNQGSSILSNQNQGSSISSNQNQGRASKSYQASSNIKWTDQSFSSRNTSLANQKAGTRNPANQMKATNSVTTQLTNEISAKNSSTNQNKSSNRVTASMTDRNTNSRSTTTLKENSNLNRIPSINSGTELKQLSKQTAVTISNSTNNDILTCNSTREKCNSNNIISGNKFQASLKSASTGNATKSSHQNSLSSCTTHASELQSPRGPPPVTRMKKLLVTVSPPDRNVESSPVGEILCEDSQSPGYETVTASKKGEVLIK